ncbi:extracellular solute-binding protein [Salipiger mangrovisoli]|uniref:Extracellular solute-binding protein n=1 Tax=Salipiger mangrovisoli TaxID=2865933 RepID=A0ABR9XA58_9RHOB|nr:extracellular solute-binding protein [Salipiger mangrovisoli]MBE9640322.1 extracellular solute-binding protein [Salipiger mangrovisoli]
MTKKTPSLCLNRRHLMMGMAAGAASLAAPSISRAAGGRVVVGTWGGDYGRLLNENIEQPFLISNGWEVIQDQSGDPERRAKMAAERRLPRGSTDIQGLTGVNMYLVYEQGLTETVDYSKLKNGGNLLPAMKHDFGVGHIYSGMVAVYNPDMVEAPKSFADVFDPKWGDKMGIIDIQYQYTMLAAALAAGGGMSDVEPGKPLLTAARAAGARIYPTNEAFAQGLSNGEIGIGVMWKARVVQWQNAGIPVQSIAPTEGAIAYESGFVIPKNAPNMEGSYAYLDAMLEPAAQEAFAEDMGYNPTITNASVPGDLQQKIGFTEEEVANLKSPDYGYILENDAEMKGWWDKDFKA